MVLAVLLAEGIRGTSPRGRTAGRRATGAGTGPTLPGMSARAHSFESFAANCGLRLEPFQKRIVKAVQGPERECVILLPRGQGKTALMALVALHHLATTERARVFCAAASREQARILFEYARDFARELDDPHL